MNGNPYYVQPGGDITPGLQGISRSMDKRREIDASEQSAADFQQAQTAAVEAYRSGDPDRVAEFVLQNPQFAKTMTSMTELRSDKVKEKYGNALFDVIQNPTAGGVKSLAEYRGAVLGSGPEDDKNTDQLLEAYEKDPKLAVEQLKMDLAWLAPEKWAEYQKATGGGDVGSGVEVKSSEILEDGTLIQSTTKGPVVYSPTGEKIEGQAAADAIKLGRAEKVSNARKAAGAKKKATLEEELALKAKVESKIISAKAAAKISGQAYDKIQVIDTNIANLREGIQLVKDGAETGAITSRFPSMRAASVKLENLQGRLGLDVLHSTTFGALSAAELKFALSTALPQKLEGPELIEWMEEKAAAQEKLSDYLESAAIYLGTPGNTVAGWIEKKRNDKAAANAPKLPEGVTEDDITATMQANNMTRDEVLARLGGQ